MGPQWEHEKILAERESYLIANIEPLLRELYQGAARATAAGICCLKTRAACCHGRSGWQAAKESGV